MAGTGARRRSQERTARAKTESVDKKDVAMSEYTSFTKGRIKLDARKGGRKTRDARKSGDARQWREGLGDTRKDVAVDMYHEAPMPDFEQCIAGASVPLPRRSAGVRRTYLGSLWTIHQLDCAHDELARRFLPSRLSRTANAECPSTHHHPLSCARRERGGPAAWQDQPTEQQQRHSRRHRSQRSGDGSVEDSCSGNPAKRSCSLD